MTLRFRTIFLLSALLGGATATEAAFAPPAPPQAAVQPRIAYSPLNPAAGRPVTFTPFNFSTANPLNWNFGDGSAPVSARGTVSHTFARPGLYVVQASTFSMAGLPTTASVSVRVLEGRGPRAAFQILFLQIRFEDGLSYKVVPRDFAPLKAFADVKFEGTGLLRAEWLVDGRPLWSVSQALTFAGAATFDSGLKSGLPTQVPGMHEVTLRILSPQVDFIVPVIRYFVAAGPTPMLREARVEVEAAEGLKGASCSLDLNTLRAPSGSYFILRGEVTYESIRPVKLGLLRVHLGGTLVDQQILRDLGPGGKRPFLTSILNRGPEAKKLYITLYDITDPAQPRLLFLKRLNVLAEEEPPRRP